MTPQRTRRLELLALFGILVLAALTRLPGIDARGRWDADQGTDMMVLRGMTVEGEVPLLGPKTSIGTFHHGAVYYYLLAPAAMISGADPVVVTGEIALFGIAAVAGTWWLARLVGGPLAAAAAGILAAISPAGIDESTFIWNPNLIPAASALAYASALMARRTGKARWWVASGIGAMVTMQCHVLGVVIVVPLAWAWGSDLVRRRRAGLPTKGPVTGGLGAAAVIALGFVPLLVHELGADFAETRAILAYLAGGGGEAATGILDRIVTVGLRSITWPVTGLITDRLAVSLIVALIVTALGVIAVVGRRRGDSQGIPGATAALIDLPAVRWLAASLGFSILALAMFAPSLAVIVPELPNDHYHAFLDPIVLALVGVGLARLAGAGAGEGSDARAGAAGLEPEAGADPGADAGAASPEPEAPRTEPGSARTLPVRLAAGLLAVVLASIAVTAWPPAVAPDGGWPLADAAAGRVLASTGDEPFALDGIPEFKNANALRFPLDRRDALVLPAGAAPTSSVVAIVCDPIFDEVTGAACGSDAEDAWLAATGRTDLGLVDRFEAGPRRLISVYATGVP
jgi:hypothetical protein